MAEPKSLREVLDELFAAEEKAGAATPAPYPTPTR